MKFSPNLFRHILFCAFLITGVLAHSQSIGRPTIIGAPACQGSNITIRFTVTNGGSGTYGFTTSTRYDVYLGTGFNSLNDYSVITSFTSETAPVYASGASATITKTITLPYNIANRTDYRIGIDSENPDPEHYSIYVSDPFQVGEAGSGADQNLTGNDNWVGHIYNGQFGTYLGRYSKPAIFDENFGNSSCFSFSYNGRAGVVNTETFSVRYRMRSSLKGLYTVAIGSDDGSRLNIDGTQVYNQWSDHGYIENQNILISLSGSSNLVLDYYENGGANRISLNSNSRPLIQNNLTQNITQSIYIGNTGQTISGDTYETYGSLPVGISKTGSGYQWYYSTSEGGAKNAIPGATGATYTPSTNITPFNTSGNYYLYRNARLSSSNNMLAEPYQASNESNVARITIEPGAAIIRQPENQTICQSSSATFSIQAAGTNLSYQWYAYNGYGWILLNNNEKYSGSTSNTLNITDVQTNMNNYLFRVVVKSEGSNEQTSASATLRVTEGPGWVSQNPDKAICAGENTFFQAYSSEASFQWQVSKNGGSSWSNLVNDFNYNNVTSSRLEIRNTSASMNNYLYRALVFKNGCSLSASPSKLNVNPLPVITAQPSNQSISVNNNAVFEVGASGNNINYRWQANSGYGWGDIYDDANQNGTSTARLIINNVQNNQTGNKYRLRITNSFGCNIISNEASLTVISGPCGDREGGQNFQDNQNLTATDSWRGHVYNGTNLETYIGFYNEPETFDQNFGGDANCFEVTANSTPVTVYTETFSVRYKMNSSRKGLYVADLGSDDGSRLKVDGNLVYDNWTPQSYSVKPRVLFSLSGESVLEYDFFENGGGNRVNFTNLVQLLENRLSVNFEQHACPGTSANPISGDNIGPLPTGIETVGSGYQWTYSTTPGGSRINITGATAAGFTPDINAAPFNSPGEYYIYRNINLSSNNNVGIESYTVSHESNPAILVVGSQISNNHISFGETGVVCATAYENATLSIAAPAGTGFTEVLFASYGTPGGNCENFSFGACHASSSQTIVEDYLIGNNSGRIPATNSVFGDPCVGTAKNLFVQAAYRKPVEPICSGTSPGTITGSAVQGGTAISYLWQSSTTGADSGFSIAAGENNLQNYNPGALNKTTWFRRKAISENCSENISEVVKIDVYAEISNNTITAGDTEICINTSPAALTGTIAEAGNINFTYNWEVSTTGPDSGFSAASGTNNSKDYAPGVLTQTTWFRRTVSSASCGSNISNVMKITVTPLPSVVLNEPVTICRGQTTYLTGNFSGNGPWKVTAKMGASTFTFNVPQEQSTYSIPVTPEFSTIYTVTGITDVNGCFNGEDVSVSVNVLQETSWTGARDTNWNNPANWSCNVVPNLDIDVRIPSGLQNYPILSSGINGLSRNLNIENGASVEIVENWLKVAGNLSNSGQLNTVSGSMAFVGNSAQIISSGAFTNNRIKNLSINNNSGVTSEAVIEVTGILKAENGHFETGNQLTLISDETHTALIDGSGNGEVTGLVDMQRYLDVAFGYKYFSSPFQRSTVGEFSPFTPLTDPETSFSNFYRYDENRRIDSLNIDATGWEAYTTTSSPLNKIEGYAVNFGVSNDPVTVELTGEVNNGYFSRNLQNHKREYTQGFHLVGNPYPSPINWDASGGWTKTNIDNGIYFFTAGDSSRYTGTYTSYVNGISSADGKSSNIIPSMQGFFVKVSDSETGSYPVNGTLGMDNAVRIVDFEQVFLKSRIIDEKQLLRLTAGFGNSEDKDAMVVYFSNMYNTDFEKNMDAHKMMNTDTRVPNLYSISTDDKQLSINALPFPKSGSYKKIPLGIRTEKSGSMEIRLEDIVNLPLNFHIYLIDMKRKIGQDLKNNPVYSFSISKGVNNSRFQLMFSEEEITDPAIAFDELFSVKNEGTKVSVQLNLKEDQQGTLQVSSVTGQILEVKEGRGKEIVEFGAITSKGVYFINLYVGEQRISKKVLIK
ncbi:hypothetical protein [Autumnicola musiva]|uniref:Uncharacterized protein n=1 Tax=Autumnicola musiva TaxID=3075589 RepID=A0ABU3D5Z0_9FLAO|nr:hypothetical protein [Zunongwangia sp. F117]MDT0676951.1 hypothetical protein [Zunongwangia sp. F117]